MMGVMKTFFQLTPEEFAHPEITTMVERGQGRIKRYLERGQALGVIRSDMPMAILTRLALEVDNWMGRWLFDEWDGTLEGLEVMAPQVIDMFRRILEAEVSFPER